MEVTSWRTTTGRDQRLPHHRRSDRRLGVAVVGGDGPELKTHLDVWRSMSNSTGYSLRVEAVQGDAAPRNGTRGRGPLSEALSDERVDIVDVCTAPPSRCRVALDALRAGKNVVVAQPIATRVEEIEELMRVSTKEKKKREEHRPLLGISGRLRSLPPFGAMLRLVREEGAIGDLSTWRSCTVHPDSRKATPPGAPGAEAGVVMGPMFDDVEFLLSCHPEAPRRIYGRGSSLSGRDGPLDFCFANIAFADGAIAFVDARIGSPGRALPLSKVEATGTKGMLRFDGRMSAPIRVLGGSGRSSQGRDDAGGRSFPARDHLYSDFEAFLGRLLNDDEDESSVSGAEGELATARRALGVCDAILSSVKSGHVLRLGSGA